MEVYYFSIPHLKLTMCLDRDALERKENDVSQEIVELGLGTDELMSLAWEHHAYRSALDTGVTVPKADIGYAPSNEIILH